MRKRKLPAYFEDYVPHKKPNTNTNATPIPNVTKEKQTKDKSANSRKKPKLHKQSDSADKPKKQLSAEEKLAIKLEESAKLRTANNWTKSGASFEPPIVETVHDAGPRNIKFQRAEFKQIDAFMLFAKDSIHIMTTKMNANRKPNGIIEYKPTDEQEVLRFWMVLIALAFVKFQALDDAWSVNPLFGSTTVRNLMTKNRFHELASMLQIDVKEFSSCINKNSGKYWKEHQTQAIDDAHPSWGGRSYLVTHKPRKKKPDGNSR